MSRTTQNDLSEKYNKDYKWCLNNIEATSRSTIFVPVALIHLRELINILVIVVIWPWFELTGVAESTSPVTDTDSRLF